MMTIDWAKFAERVLVGSQCRYLSDAGTIKYGVLQENYPYCELDSAAQASAEREIAPMPSHISAIEPCGFLTIQLFEERWESGECVSQMPAELISFDVNGAWLTFEQVMTCT